MKPTFLFLFVLCLGIFTVLSIATPIITQSDKLFAEKFLKQDFIEPTQESINLSQIKSMPVPFGSKLDLTQTTFNLDNANIMARLASAAYCAPIAVKDATKTRLKTWTCQACLDSGVILSNVTPFHIAVSDLFGYVGYHAQTNSIQLVFTGSQSIVNWLYNLDASFIQFGTVPNAQVHKGFYNMWIYARPTVVGLLDTLLYRFPQATISVSGHSLGGAIAQLATLDLKTAMNGYTQYNLHGVDVMVANNDFDDQAIPFQLSSFPKKTFLQGLNSGKYAFSTTWTFGQPRVGNTVFSDYYSKKVGNNSLVRLVHQKDPVPHVPPLALWPTALHSFFEVFYTTRYSNVGDFILCSDAPESQKCSNQYPIPVSFDDHLHYFGYHLGTNSATC